MAIRVKKRGYHYRKARIRLIRGIIIRNFIWVAVIIFLGISIFGLKKLYVFVKSSEYFAVKKINVFGTKNSFTEDIIDLSGISIGDNIFSFSSTKSAEQIRNHPWVKKVLVNKHLPDRVSIEITEYKPAMFINFTKLYLVDENAVVFKAFEPNELFDFPVISGISKEDYLNQTDYYRQKIFSIFEIVNRFERLFPQIIISEIFVEKEGDITIISAKNSFEIRLGQGNFEKKFAILNMIFNKVKDSDIYPEIVYLDTNREGFYSMKVKQRK